MTDDNSHPNDQQPTNNSITVQPDQAARAGFEPVPQSLVLGSELPKNLTMAQKEQWIRQERFLAGFREQGTMTHAATVSGVPTRTVVDWRRLDNLGFNTRLDAAVAAHADRMERVLFDVAEATTTTTNPAALIFTMKGLKREKYGDRVIDTDARDSGRTIASEVRAWRRRTVVEEEVVMEERSGQRRRRE